VGRLTLLNRFKLADDNPILLGARAGVDRAFDLVDERTRGAEYLAGDEFTSADIMTGFTLTTMRYFQPYDLARCPDIVGYLSRIANRPAYRRAMEKGDPGMELLLT
jgi:glutathione S-transferase